jgi:Sperm-tail PG-rich repeat
LEYAETPIAKYFDYQVFLKQNPPRDDAIPGPGAYKTTKDAGKGACKYTMRPKTTLQST